MLLFLVTTKLYIDSNLRFFMEEKESFKLDTEDLSKLEHRLESVKLDEWKTPVEKLFDDCARIDYSTTIGKLCVILRSHISAIDGKIDYKHRADLDAVLISKGNNELVSNYIETNSYQGIRTVFRNLDNIRVQHLKQADEKRVQSGVDSVKRDLWDLLGDVTLINPKGRTY